jgi:hypothetical protein
MKKLFTRFSFLLALGLLIGALSVEAQTTSVTATVVDSTGTVWVNGTIIYTFRGNGSFGGQYQWQGANLPANYLTATTVNLDATGSATFNLPDNTTISPAGSSWTMNFCPQASTACSIITSLPVSGTTQNISSVVTANILPPAITLSNMPLAYSDAEISTVPRTGGLYFNTGLGSPGVRLWNGVAFTPIGSGSGGSGLTGSYTITSGEIIGLNTGSVVSLGFPCTISSFTAAQTVEIGTAIVAPTLSIGYSNCAGLITAAQVTNTAGVQSPLALSTPYTTAAYSGTFNLNTQGAITFTASATGATNSSNLNYNYDYRSYAGVGTSGATNCTASGSVGAPTCTLVGATGVLNSAALNTSGGGFTSNLNPSGQFMYFMLYGCSHTFTVNTFATVFTSVAATYTSLGGATVSSGYCFYTSPGSYTGAYTVVVN